MKNEIEAHGVVWRKYEKDSFIYYELANFPFFFDYVKKNISATAPWKAIESGPVARTFKTQKDAMLFLVRKYRETCRKIINDHSKGMDISFEAEHNRNQSYSGVMFTIYQNYYGFLILGKTGLSSNSSYRLEYDSTYDGKESEVGSKLLLRHAKRFITATNQNSKGKWLY